MEATRLRIAKQCVCDVLENIGGASFVSLEGSVNHFAITARHRPWRSSLCAPWEFLGKVAECMCRIETTSVDR